MLAWPIKLREGISIEPSIGAFNMFNMANFHALTGGLVNTAFQANLPGLVNPGGSVNGTNTAGREAVRVGTGSGVFAVGAPRQLEFGLRLNF